MLRMVNDDRVFEPSPGVALIGTETAMLVGGRLARVGVSYSRPTTVRLGSREPIAIVDHVMVVRLVTLALVLTAMLWRLLRD